VGWVNHFNARNHVIVRGATNLRHNRGIMMHSLLVGAVYVAMVLAPCAIALFTTHRHSHPTS
jgi:hypothetical protein